MMYVQRTSPRAEYRRRQFEQVTEAPTLAKKFPRVKSLRILLEYCDPNGFTPSRMKYTVNIDHAKSLFCFNCPTAECVGGDYNLSEQLSTAISAKKKMVSGETRCQGTRHYKDKRGSVPCQNLLRYELHLTYLTGKPKSEAAVVGENLD